MVSRGLLWRSASSLEIWVVWRPCRYPLLLEKFRELLFCYHSTYDWGSTNDELLLIPTYSRLFYRWRSIGRVESSWHTFVVLQAERLDPNVQSVFDADRIQLCNHILKSHSYCSNATLYDMYIYTYSSIGRIKFIIFIMSNDIQLKIVFENLHIQNIDIVDAPIAAAVRLPFQLVKTAHFR